MASQNLYPKINQSNPNTSSYTTPSAPSLYPSLDYTDLHEDLFIDTQQSHDPHTVTSIPSFEEIIIQIPNSIIHLIDKQQSIELASGVLQIVRLRQGNAVIAVFARVNDVIQWPLAKDVSAVKLDGSHYFFTLRIISDTDSDSETDNMLNYGLTIVNGDGLGEFDRVLDEYSAFSVKEVKRNVVVVDDGGSSSVEAKANAYWTTLAPNDGGSSSVEAKANAYWTTLAPNVEDYSGSVARAIAAGSGQLIKGIMWCGDVTVDRLKWGNEVLKKKRKPGVKAEVSPQALKRMKRVKRLTKMSEGMATGVLSGVVKVSGVVTGSIVNSKPGKKFFNLLPGEIVLASLDGFNKVCDAIEAAGKNVMSTTSTVTTDYVSHRHGEDAAKLNHEKMSAAGHAIGTAWAVFKIRQALNPKSAIKPTTLVKAAASQVKSSKSKS